MSYHLSGSNTLNTTFSHSINFMPRNAKCNHIESPPKLNNDRPVSLVTGGAGFIGIHLCKQLLKMGHQVYCLDIKNLFTVRIQFLDEPNFTYLECNILNMMDEKYQKIHACGHCYSMVNVFQYHNIDRIDYIYHLACDASPPIYQKNKNNTMNVCTAGTMNVIKLAQSMKNAKVLLASTSEVYGEPIKHPQSETDPLNIQIGPRACYDVGKIAAEVLLNDAEIPGGKRIARIFNTYGPGLDDGRVMSNFIKQAMNSKKLTICGDGSQTRSFCYVADTVDGLIKLMDSNYELPVNIGNPHEILISELANLIIQKINPELTIEYLSLPVHDPSKRCPNIQLAGEKLHWAPKIALNDGIDKVIAWFKSLKSEIKGSNTYIGNHGC